VFAFSTGKARSFTRARRRRRAQAIAGELAKAIKELGHAVPYGIYYLAANTGWVSVGIDNDTKSGVSCGIPRRPTF
jgi:Rhodopirellula transposase DDE domain